MCAGKKVYNCWMFMVWKRECTEFILGSHFTRLDKNEKLPLKLQWIF